MPLNVRWLLDNSLEELRKQLEPNSLQDDLEEILILYLSDNISKSSAFSGGESRLREAYLFIVPSETSEFKDILESYLEGWREIIRGRALAPFWEGIEGLKRRVGFLVGNFKSALKASATIQTARIKGVQIKWVTMGDLRVCPICLGNERAWNTDDPNLPVLPAHPLCRCWWEMI
jgi:hypothetical protein